MDTFWHLMVGRWILEHRALPSENVWSAADPSQPYRAVQWLFEAGAAAIERVSGLEGVRLVNAGWLTATFVLFFVLLRRRLGLGALASLFWTLALLAAFQDRIRVRPHVVNLTVELALVFYVVGLGRARRWHAIAFLPLFAVWAAIHAGGAWVFLLCLSWLALATLVWERVEGVRRLGPTLLLCTGAAALGWVLSPEALGSMGTIAVAPMSYVPEWRSWPALGREVSAVGLPGFVLARLFPPAAALALGAAALRYLRSVRPDADALRRHGVPRELLLAAALVAFSFVWVRYFYFAVLALVLVVAGWRRTSESLELPTRPAPKRRGAAALLGSAALAAVVLLYEGNTYPSAAATLASRGETVDDRVFPVLSTQLLVESGIEARVGTLPNWGGYVSYHGHPRLRTTVDGRFLAPERVLALTQAIVEVYAGERDPALLHELFGALPADFVLMPHPAFPAGVPTGEWVLVASSPVEDLYMRTSTARPDWVRRLRAVAERRP